MREVLESARGGIFQGALSSITTFRTMTSVVHHRQKNVLRPNGFHCSKILGVAYVRSQIRSRCVLLPQDIGNKHPHPKADFRPRDHLIRFSETQLIILAWIENAFRTRGG
ncbi:hypothetical protein CEXT_485381 [Caerostris extrusa]|uniref:Uncharacterized protein n=1 Tax=Caerostris extrusa TaxID=172846 RepID=A0AAV4XVF5_CAEEX|nr:hypothetical protein CEXT_485381 [Caerostris extrusa]